MTRLEDSRTKFLRVFNSRSCLEAMVLFVVEPHLECCTMSSAALLHLPKPRVWLRQMGGADGLRACEEEPLLGVALTGCAFGGRKIRGALCQTDRVAPNQR